jgi:hypothetical protein
MAWAPTNFVFPMQIPFEGRRNRLNTPWIGPMYQNEKTRQMKNRWLLRSRDDHVSSGDLAGFGFPAYPAQD